MKIFYSLLVLVLLTTFTAVAQNSDMNLAIKNTVTEANFLEQNKARPEVKVTKSGLQYEVLTEGEGTSPKLNDLVTVQYEGKLLDGTVFDSSYRRNQPATFVLNQVIRGWSEGLQLMKPGAVYILYIPAKLGYGIEGRPGSIGPNECLIFKVELLSVKSQP